MSDKQTNKERIMNMLFNICGCSDIEAVKLLEECIKDIKNKRAYKDSPLKKDMKKHGWKFEEAENDNTH